MRPFEVRPDDLVHCESLLRVGSKSFSLAGKLLPKPIRDRATVLYAFCRVSDDTVDDDPHASARTIAAMRERLRLVYAGRPKNDPVDRAFSALLEDTTIPQALPEALFEGMQWDVDGRRYATLEELEAYAARVAGTVGAMMTLVMGRRGEEVLARACDLGVAMQLTNVARDIGEDARKGRIYAPLAWLDGEDVEAWLARPVASERWRGVVERLLAAADALYVRADHGIPLLPQGCRIAIRAARLVYADIGRAIRAQGCDSVTTRAFVSHRRKLWLVARSVAALWMRSPPLGAPPLPATAPLVAACEAS